MAIHRIIAVLLLLLCLSVTGLAQAEDLLSRLQPLSRFQPYVSVSSVYTDNLNLTAENKKEDFITTVQPGIRYSNMEGRAGIEFDYALGAVFYSKNSNLDYISHRASLNAQYLTPQKINFYLRNSLIRSDDPREREYFTTDEENRYVLATQNQRLTYWRNVLAPKVEYRFGPDNRLGLNFRNNLFRTNNPASQDSRENYLNPFFSYWFDRRNGIDLEYGFTQGNFDRSPNLRGHRWHGRYTHRFSSLSSVFTEYTFSKRSFTSPGVGYDIHESSIGINHSFSPSLSGSLQAGYFWKRSDLGRDHEGFSYKGQLKNILDPRTTFVLSLQGGYTEDYFTSENLGFNRYHRLTGSLTHRPERRLSVGGFGSIERAEFEHPNHKDTIWGIGTRASYMPLKWLTLALELSHRMRDSNVAAYEYRENRAMITMTATYR